MTCTLSCDRDLAWAPAIARYMFDQGYADTKFLEARVNGVTEYRRSLEPFTLAFPKSRRIPRAMAGERPPGLMGVYRLLRDEQLWRALTPIIAGLKGFAEGLEKPVSKPISDCCGKSGRPS